MPTVRIMIVDDHEVVRIGLRALLERRPGFRVVAEASSAEEAVRKALDHRPDVVVMDIRLPGGSGIEATRRIVEALPDTRVVMLTSYAEDELLLEAIEAGASGYVLKQIGSDELIMAIERVARGEALIDPSMTPHLLRHVRAARRRALASAFKGLTEQELRVLALIAEGKTNREIAQALVLSEGTVRNYVSSILDKLGLSNRAEAAAYAVEHNIKAYLDEGLG